MARLKLDVRVEKLRLAAPFRISGYVFEEQDAVVATLSAIDREELLVRVRALAANLEEPFPFRYISEVHVIPRSSDGGPVGGGTSIQG